MPQFEEAAALAPREIMLLTEHLLGASTDCIKLVSKTGVLKFMNAAGRTVFGFPDEGPVPALSWPHCWQGPEREKAERALEQAAAGKSSNFVGHVDIGGKSRWWSVAVSPVRDPSCGFCCILVVSRDITEQEETRRSLLAAQEDVRNRDRLFREIIDHVPDPVFLKGADGRFIFVNRRCADLLGVHPDAVVGKVGYDFLPRDTAEQFAANDARVLRERAGVVVEETIDGPEGTLRFVSTKLPWHFKDGSIGVLGVAHEVTALIDLAATLADREERLRTILDAIPECVKVVSPDGTVMEMNRAGLRMVAASGEADIEDVRGRPVLDLVHPADHAAFQRLHDDALASAGVWTGRFRLLIDGDERLVSSQSTRLHGPDGSLIGVLSVTGDISAAVADAERLRQLQAEFAHLARVNDLGEMGAAIAHELNQPLAAFNNYVSAAALKVSDAPDDAESLRDLLHLASAQALRAGAIVRRMRRFGSKSGGERRREVVGEIVTSSLALCRAEADRRNVTLTLSGALDADLFVHADSIQLQQVLVNLLRNAVDATCAQGRGGTVEIALEQRAGQAVIAVTDQGGGIPDAIAPRLFEPFATSKPDGMGMGLAISRRIVEAHEGEIAAAPAGARGTRFEVRLPLIDLAA